METAGSNLIESIMNIFIRKARLARECNLEDISGWLKNDMGVSHEDDRRQDHASNKIRY